MEASEDKRIEYGELIKGIDTARLIYIDESGMELNATNDKGWGKKGVILKGKKSGKYYQRTNIMAGYVNGEVIAPFVFNGSCDTALFEGWVEQFLIKELKPGQFVIMDNAAFHKSQKTKTLIESVGCQVIFLPPYSPDLNPIEKFWANLKRWIRNHINNFATLSLAFDSFFSSPNST